MQCQKLGFEEVKTVGIKHFGGVPFQNYPEYVYNFDRTLNRYRRKLLVCFNLIILKAAILSLPPTDLLSLLLLINFRSYQKALQCW